MHNDDQIKSLIRDIGEKVNNEFISKEEALNELVYIFQNTISIQSTPEDNKWIFYDLTRVCPNFRAFAVKASEIFNDFVFKSYYRLLFSINAILNGF